MNADLRKAIKRHGFKLTEFPTEISTGGSSDDCHGAKIAAHRALNERSR